MYDYAKSSSVNDKFCCRQQMVIYLDIRAHKFSARYSTRMVYKCKLRVRSPVIMKDFRDDLRLGL